MARPLRIQYPGAYYHVTCRGNDRRKIFFDSEDQKIFLEKLFLSLEIYNVSLLAYVCMPNHFHLLVTTPRGNLSEFMRHFNISYTAAFNRRHRRVGHLYQGRYKSFLIDADSYLLEVSRYIHLNPIRKMSSRKEQDELLNYEGSSLLGYVSVGKRENFVNYKTVLDFMRGDNRKGRQDYLLFVKRGIGQEIENPLEIGRGNGIVGDFEFVQRIKRFLTKKTSKREQPALRVLGKEFKPEELIDHFARLVGMKKADICQRGKKSIERAMLMELLYRFCQITQPTIGKLVGGIDYSAVSQARKRLHVKLRKEPKLEKRFSKLSNQFQLLSRGKI